MHRIDRLELLDTVAQLRREARLLAAEGASPDRLTRIRRIAFLLRYMAEHLEMLGAAGPAVRHADATPGAEKLVN